MTSALNYLFIHRFRDYAYAEIRSFAPGRPSRTLAQSTLHDDMPKAAHEMAAWAGRHAVSIVRAHVIRHDFPFN